MNVLLLHRRRRNKSRNAVDHKYFHHTVEMKGNIREKEIKHDEEKALMFFQEKGSQTVKQVPCPGLLLTSILPL